jgi:hypothetical protein
MLNVYEIGHGAGIDVISGMNHLTLGPGRYETSDSWEQSVLGNYPGVVLISSTGNPAPAPTEEDQKITALSKRLSAVESVLAKVKTDIES